MRGVLSVRVRGFSSNIFLPSPPRGEGRKPSRAFPPHLGKEGRETVDRADGVVCLRLKRYPESLFKILSDAVGPNGSGFFPPFAQRLDAIDQFDGSGVETHGVPSLEGDGAASGGGATVVPAGASNAM